jgi:hypothetical protein
LTTTLIPQAYQFPAIVLLLIGGVIAWSAGYRLFRLVLTVYGFLLGALIGSSMMGPTDTTMLIFAALGGGAVGALVMFFGYFVGVALVGAAVGVVAIHSVWARLGSDPHAAVVIFAAVAGAAGAMALQRYVIIIATAFGGAWTMLIGGLALRTPGRPLRSDVWLIYPLDLSGGRWMFVGWLLLGALGVFIQFRFTGTPVRRTIGRRKEKKTA